MMECKPLIKNKEKKQENLACMSRKQIQQKIYKILMPVCFQEIIYALCMFKFFTLAVLCIQGTV